jgi:hypothetical protein
MAEVAALWSKRWPRSGKLDAEMLELYTEVVRGRPMTAITTAARECAKADFRPSPNEFAAEVRKAAAAERAALPVPQGVAPAPGHGALPDAQWRTAEALGKVEAGIETKLGRHLDTRERVQALSAVTSALWTVYRAVPLSERQALPCLRAHGTDLTVPWVRETVRAATLGVIEQLRTGRPFDTGDAGPLSGSIVDATTGQAA